MRKSFVAIALAFAFVASFNAQAQRLTLEESVRQQFTVFAPESIDQLEWLPNTDTYAYVKDTVVMSGVPKKAEKVFFSLSQLKQWTGMSDLKAIPDMHWQSATQFYFVADHRYYHVDIKAGSYESARHTYDKAENEDYSVAARRLAFTMENDLYVTSGDRLIRVTENPKNIVSGQSVSRNEYGIEKGTFWSEDGGKLAFYQKDEAKVSDYPLTDYTTVPASVKNIKYPMAGATSEIISLGVYDVNAGTTVFLDINNGQKNDQYYATNLTWGADNKYVYVAMLNRQTTEMKFIAFDASTGKEHKVLFTETDEKWMEPTHPAYFIKGHPTEFLWFSERDGFRQLFHYNSSGELKGKTTAKFQLLEFLGFDAKGELAYVTGTGLNATETHAFVVNLKDMNIEMLTPAEGVHQVKIASNGKYVLDTYSSLNVPGKVDLLDHTGKLIKNMLASKNPLASRTIGTTEIFTIKSNLGDDLYCRLIKPSNFDPSKKYPVVVYVYNGPHVQLVTNNWLGGASLWMHYLAEDGYLVFTVDGHGSDHRGSKFEKVIHRQLGTQEIEDQMAGAEWLKKQSFVDANRMGVHGWSFGGFMTSSLMLRKPGTFKVGVAGGPVIDWNLYEVMYTERYMDTPQENPEGYKTADVTGYIKNLKGKLLMIHGMNDNVVVMQHNVKFLKSAVDSGVQVDFFAYPGHEHNVRGRDRVHLMRKVIDYLESELK
jgi:dipeptidyl-peptidase 4